MLRGLTRIRERASRPGEWEQDGRGAGLLLRYLVEHLEDETPPEGLAELRDMINRLVHGQCVSHLSVIPTLIESVIVFIKSLNRRFIIAS